MTPTPRPSPITETMTGTISGGDPMCSVWPCQSFTRTFSSAGRVDADLSWDTKNGLLSLQLFDAQLNVVSFAAFDNTTAPAHERFAVNVQPGRYTFRVNITYPVFPVPFSLTTTHPN